MEDDDVDDLTLEQTSPHSSRLDWTAVEGVHCEYHIAYSVFRAETSEFEPSSKSLMVRGLLTTHYLAYEPKANGNYYYHVRAVRIPETCTTSPSEPQAQLRSGTVVTFPLDPGKEYPAVIGDKVETCKATSTAELACDNTFFFHAVVASQSSHEYLIGCLGSDYEADNWTCVNLGTGVYSVLVHSKAVTFYKAGFGKMNMKTGKRLSNITPVFSVLGVLR